MYFIPNLHTDYFRTPKHFNEYKECIYSSQRPYTCYVICMNNGQSRETDHIDGKNITETLEDIEGAITNGQSRETDHIDEENKADAQHYLLDTTIRKQMRFMQSN